MELRDRQGFVPQPRDLAQHVHAFTALGRNVDFDVPITIIFQNGLAIVSDPLGRDPEAAYVE